MRAVIDPFDKAGHVEGVEIVHDPAVANVDFLQMKLSVVSIEIQRVTVPFSLVRIVFDKIKKTFIVVGLDAEGNYLIDG
jgi:hypothetical protein